MDEVELRQIAEKASGLDRLVPKIVEGLRAASEPDDFRRLGDLLRLAERFLIDAGPSMSRVKPEDAALREAVERFMREMPRRLRMIRDAQSILPPILPPMPPDQPFAQTG